MDYNPTDTIIKRYTLRPQNEHEDNYIDMWIQSDEDDTGDWVKYDELHPLFDRLEYLEHLLNIANTKIIKAKEVLS